MDDTVAERVQNSLRIRKFEKEPLRDFGNSKYPKIVKKKRKFKGEKERMSLKFERAPSPSRLRFSLSKVEKQ